VREGFRRLLEMHESRPQRPSTSTARASEPSSINILLAVRDGERDLNRLKTLALNKISDLY